MNFKYAYIIRLLYAHNTSKKIKAPEGLLGAFSIVGEPDNNIDSSHIVQNILELIILLQFNIKSIF